MKKYLYTLCTAALLGLATSCVDSFDATNQNPNNSKPKHHHHNNQNNHHNNNNNNRNLCILKPRKWIL